MTVTLPLLFHVSRSLRLFLDRDIFYLSLIDFMFRMERHLALFSHLLREGTLGDLAKLMLLERVFRSFSLVESALSLLVIGVVNSMGKKRHFYLRIDLEDVTCK